MVSTLLSMFLKSSSSSSVSAWIMGSILPVFRLGTLNTSFISLLESMRPDQENRWIRLEIRKDCQFSIG